MPEWIIITKSDESAPTVTHYTSLDEALVQWEHLKQIRRHTREDKRETWHPYQHDYLVMIVDDKEYLACHLL